MCKCKEYGLHILAYRSFVLSLQFGAIVWWFTTIMTLFCELFVDFDCLEDDFWHVDYECNYFCLHLFLSKYLPFVNNVIGFSFSNFDFNVNYFCFMFTILNYRFKFGMFHWIETKPCHEKRKHEKSNETCCSLNFIFVLEASSIMFCHFSRNSFTNFDFVNMK